MKAIDSAMENSALELDAIKAVINIADSINLPPSVVDRTSKIFAPLRSRCSSASYFFFPCPMKRFDGDDAKGRLADGTQGYQVGHCSAGDCQESRGRVQKIPAPDHARRSQHARAHAARLRHALGARGNCIHDN